MPVDRKALKQRMKERQEQGRATAKAILYPLPDLKGPGGNAFALLGNAANLMKKADVPENVRSEFHAEATSGDYEHLLRTLQQWFTVVVADVQYVPIGDRDIVQFRPNEDGEYDEWEEFDADSKQAPEELDESLESYEANAERDRKIAEVQDKINREVRAELGLDEDDVVIVQVKKAKKK